MPHRPKAIRRINLSSYMTDIYTSLSAFCEKKLKKQPQGGKKHLPFVGLFIILGKLCAGLRSFSIGSFITEPAIMASTRSFFASIFSLHSSARRRRQVFAARKLKLSLKNSVLELLEERQLLSISQPEPIPGLTGSLVGQTSLRLTAPYPEPAQSFVAPRSQPAQSPAPVIVGPSPAPAFSTSTSDAAQPGSSSSAKSLSDLEGISKYVISSSIGAEEPFYHLANTSQGYSFKHDYNVVMNASGATYKTGLDTWQFTPETFGYGNAQQSIGVSSLSGSKNKVTYDAAGIDTWFINGPLGVQ